MTEGGRPTSDIEASAGSPTSSANPLANQIIRISDRADSLIEQWASALLHDELQLWQLPRGLQAFWNLAYFEGHDSRQPEIDRAHADADRLYGRLYNPSKELKPAPASYADMERRRGNPERAAQYEQFLQHLLANFGGNSSHPAAEDRTTE